MYVPTYSFLLRLGRRKRRQALAAACSRYVLLRSVKLANRGTRACALGLPQPVTGPGRVTIATGRNVVERLVVAGAEADAVDGRVDEAKVVMGILVGQRHDPPPTAARSRWCRPAIREMPRPLRQRPERSHRSHQRHRPRRARPWSSGSPGRLPDRRDGHTGG
jgi:hypothetical protein